MAIKMPARCACLKLAEWRALKACALFTTSSGMPAAKPQATAVAKADSVGTMYTPCLRMRSLAS